MSQKQAEGKSAYEAGAQAKGNHIEGDIHIENDVIAELAKKTILGIPNIQLANMGIASKFGIGRKAADGIRVSKEEGKIPELSVDVFIVVKYGQRIPDLAWDVQEKVKANLERYTGYIVKAVNVNVHGIYLEEPALPEKEEKETEESSGLSLEKEEKEEQEAEE